jgi:hypothetical protein
MFDWRINRLNYRLPNRTFAKTFKDNRWARLVDINAVVDETNEILEQIGEAFENFDFCNITLTPQEVVEGTPINLNVPGIPTNNGSVLGPAVVIPGVLELVRRDDGGSWYNQVSELGFGIGSPADTEWNSSFTDGVNNGFGDLTNLSSRTYGTFLEALDFQVGVEYSGLELICHVISTDQYFKVLITNWDSNLSAPYGGFSATFQEVTVPAAVACK